MIKAVLFDLDGVLVDACDWHYHALNQALEEISGITIERDEHMSTFNGLPTGTKLTMLVDAGRISADDFDRIAALKQSKVKDAIRQYARHDESKMGMMKMLRHYGIKIACVTNSIRETASLMLELTGQLNYVDLLISNEDVVNPKPSDEGYRSAMMTFKVLPSETLIVEDSPKGKQAARDSGGRLIEVENAKRVNWALLRDLVS